MMEAVMLARLTVLLEFVKVVLYRSSNILECV